MILSMVPNHWSRASLMTTPSLISLMTTSSAKRHSHTYLTTKMQGTQSSSELVTDQSLQLAKDCSESFPTLILPKFGSIAQLKTSDSESTHLTSNVLMAQSLKSSSIDINFLTMTLFFHFDIQPQRRSYLKQRSISKRQIRRSLKQP